MERLTQKLTKLGTVGIDTPAFIYHLEAHAKYLPQTQKCFSSLENGKWHGITSTITLMEINVHPWRVGREDVARKYETLLMNFAMGAKGLLTNDHRLSVLQSLTEIIVLDDYLGS
jgi:hypothetical protein